jgi:DNA-binding response OmpR family regulator
MLITILEDDQAQRENVTRYLENEGYDVKAVGSLSAFYSECIHLPMDMAILDWELPDGTGIEVLQRLRHEIDNDVAVFFITQRDSEEDIVQALETGADDYLVKPIRHQELIARVKALGRRIGAFSESSIISLGPIRIDKESRHVSIDGESIKLTNKDYHLACCILANPGKLMSREFLLKAVWGLSSDINTRTVDVHISRIRRALKLGPHMGYSLRNIYQHGYRLEKLAEISEE